MNGHSYTSNEVKLFKHLDSLKSFQAGKAKPVMFHIAPTNYCNMKCSHCCFDGRDTQEQLTSKDLISALTQMYWVGAKSIEWTGGGEPTLHPDLANLTEFAKGLDFHVGMCTNGLVYRKDMDYELFDWIRVSLNIFDQTKSLDKWKDNVRRMSYYTKVTSCYVASKDMPLKKFKDISKFATEYKIPTRITPDCIQPKEGIEKLIGKLNHYKTIAGDSEYVFISDFNIDLGDREDNFCAMHSIKPFLFADGYIYPCPSSELAPENNKTVPKKFRLCHMEDIEEYYKKPVEIKNNDCSYCKYTNQNNILHSIIKEVEDDKFC